MLGRENTLKIFRDNKTEVNKQVKTLIYFNKQEHLQGKNIQYEGISQNVGI